MKENEMENLGFQKKLRVLYFLLFFFLLIAAICIGSVLYINYERKKDPANLSEMVSGGTEKEGVYIELEVGGKPELIAVNKSSDEHIYFVPGADDRIYIAKLSSRTAYDLISHYEKEGEESNLATYVNGFIYKIDGSIQTMAIYNSNKIFKDGEVNGNNFTEYFGRVYIEENRFPEGRKIVELFKSIVLCGVFFLALAIGVILPMVMKVQESQKRMQSHEEILEELRRELKEYEKNPYKEFHIQLTEHYIKSDFEIVRYDDIIWGYTEILSKFIVKTGKELIVYTKDKKRHTLLSVGASSCGPDDVLKELQRRNPRMRVGYDEENKRFFESYEAVSF